jgi:hypothetical protein
MVLASPDRGFQKLKKSMKKVSDTGPWMPYLGMLLIDLEFIYEANGRDEVPGAITFGTRNYNFYRSLEYYLKTRYVEYNFPEIPNFLELLMEDHIKITPNQERDISLFLEPRAGAYVIISPPPADILKQLQERK